MHQDGPYVKTHYMAPVRETVEALVRRQVNRSWDSGEAPHSPQREEKVFRNTNNTVFSLFSVM